MLQVDHLNIGDKLKFKNGLIVIVLNTFDKVDGLVSCIAKDALGTIYEFNFQKNGDKINLTNCILRFPFIYAGKKITLPCGLSAKIKNILSQTEKYARCLVSTAGSFSAKIIEIKIN